SPDRALDTPAARRSTAEGAEHAENFETFSPRAARSAVRALPRRTDSASDRSEMARGLSSEEGLMTHGRSVLACLLLAGCLLAITSPAWSQQASGISGIVRDASGAVLPGVTVEASSPVLIEKVRTAVTDTEGRFNLTELRPGVYSVTFTLPSFKTV